MHPRRAKTRGRGRIPRWGPNPPPPSPPPSSPPPPPSPPAGEQAGENELDLRRMFAQFTRTVSTALQGRCNTKGSDIKRVKEFGAKEFFGSSDPAKVETWLIDLERVFEVLQCSDEDRVRLAAFLLKGNAYHWWKTVRRDYANTAAITWEEFQRLFFEQFYPHSYQNAKKSEFENLR
ncbi:hypothetical protein CerSpe_209810 [Prunus speciosa]